MRNFLIVCLIAAVGGGVLAACPIRSRVVVHAPAKVVKKVVVADVATVIPVAVYPLAITVPTYTAAYTPPVAPAVAAPAATVQDVRNSDLRAIIDAIKTLDARLQRLEKGTTPAPAPAPKEKDKPKDPFNPAPLKGGLSGLSVLTAKCAVCHESKVAATKGSSIVLFDGTSLAKLSDKTARKVLGVAYRGTMPPKDSKIAALTDEEVSAIVDLIDK